MAVASGTEVRERVLGGGTGSCGLLDALWVLKVIRILVQIPKPNYNPPKPNTLTSQRSTCQGPRAGQLWSWRIEMQRIAGLGMLGFGLWVRSVQG